MGLQNPEARRRCDADRVDLSGQLRPGSHRGEDCGRVSGMSGSAPTSSPLPRRGRTRHPGRSFGAPAAAAFALLLIGSAGCNSPLSFNTPPLPGGSGGVGNGGLGGQNGGVGGQNGGVGGQNGGVG